jgi:hypothetical protein
MAGMRRQLWSAEATRRRSAKRPTSTKIQRTPAALEPILTHLLDVLLPIDASQEPALVNLAFSRCRRGLGVLDGNDILEALVLPILR